MASGFYAFYIIKLQPKSGLEHQVLKLGTVTV